MSEQKQRSLDDYKQSYVDLFGSMPPLPLGKFDFAESIDPDFLKLAEEVRYRTFFSDDLDHKTIQLVCFALLLNDGSPAAKHHAVAALKLGATWGELWLMCKIASTVSGGLGPLNLGGSLLNDLKKESDNGK
ncbi:MAG: carboxymuconolactone decarboxylase family protein [Candidatus Obscuribacterales bacterium]|nr:carboxymuconolactone decarboxylase family protein [Candidatus Obscuribacterales bacterium]